MDCVQWLGQQIIWGLLLWGLAFLISIFRLTGSFGELAHWYLILI